MRIPIRDRWSCQASKEKNVHRIHLHSRQKFVPSLNIVPSKTDWGQTPDKENLHLRCERGWGESGETSSHARITRQVYKTLGHTFVLRFSLLPMITSSGIMVESSAPTAEEVAKMEQESLLKTVKGKQLQDGPLKHPRNEITLAQPLPMINDRTSLPAFSGLNTLTHQRNHPEKMVKLWKQQGK